jgi:hypothetical protein
MGTTNTASSEILVFVRDPDNVLLSEVPVHFGSDPDSDATIQEIRNITDETGSAEAIVTTIGNPRNRTATVTASAGGVDSSIAIAITGTSLSLSGPTNISAGSKTTYTASLTDSDGNGISSETISIESEIPNLEVATTNAQGEISFDLQPTTAGSYPVEVSAYSGESRVAASLEINVSDSDFTFTAPTPGSEVPIGPPATLTFAWSEGGVGQSGEPISFSITRGSINGNLSYNGTTDGNGEITTTVSSTSSGPATIKAQSATSNLSTSMDIEFVATTPENIVTQVSQTQLKSGEKSRITAIVRDANNNLVKGERVLFNVKEDVSSGNLSSPDAVTDSLGRASTVFTAGSSGTGSNGTVVTATVADDTSISDDASLTISDGALRISIGTGNTIQEDGEPTYLKEWVVFVSDVNGQPVPDAEVELTVLPSQYYKGEWVPGICGSGTEPNCWVAAESAECPAEDVNYNGKIDTGEDVNNSGHLEPTNEAVAVSASDTSAEDGAYNFALKYPQSACTWTEVKVAATVSVGETESTEMATTRLSCLASDLTDLDVTPPAINGGSRYGRSTSCLDAD